MFGVQLSESALLPVMDNTIKETLRALNLNEILSSPTIDDFVNFAVAIQAQGKRGNVGNSGQLPYFAIHLSCLKYLMNGISN